MAVMTRYDTQNHYQKRVWQQFTNFRTEDVMGFEGRLTNKKTLRRQSKEIIIFRYNSIIFSKYLQNISFIDIFWGLQSIFNKKGELWRHSTLYSVSNFLVYLQLYLFVFLCEINVSINRWIELCFAYIWVKVKVIFVSLLIDIWKDKRFDGKAF